MATAKGGNNSQSDRLTSMIVKQPAPFLSKTWSLLDDPENAHLITWSPSGDSFIVPRPDNFARELLPTVFKHNNYTSFVRQLNIYGFRKLPAAHQEFCHPCFKRGQPQLLSQICRGGMPASSAHAAEGPAAEISSLKSQVEKLSKALTYALAELHRRGYDTLRFDWKELVFVDPSATIAPASVPKAPADAAAVTPSKRAAQSGSMLHLQNSVDEVRELRGVGVMKADSGEGPAIKLQRTENGPEAAVPPPQMPPQGPQPDYTHMHPQQYTPGVPHASAAVPMHAVGLPQPDANVPGPYMTMHPHEAAAGAPAAAPQPEHAVVPPVPEHGVPAPPDGVPAPPSGAGMYEMGAQPAMAGASVGLPVAAQSIAIPAAPLVPSGYEQHVEVANGVSAAAQDVANGSAAAPVVAEPAPVAHPVDPVTAGDGKGDYNAYAQNVDVNAEQAKDEGS